MFEVTESITSTFSARRNVRLINLTIENLPELMVLEVPVFVHVDDVVEKRRVLFRDREPHFRKCLGELFLTGVCVCGGGGGGGGGKGGESRGGNAP